VDTIIIDSKKAKGTANLESALDEAFFIIHKILSSEGVELFHAKEQV